MATQRELVVPGDLLDDSGRMRAGPNTYREKGAVYAARLGLKEVRGDTVTVLGLSGRYDPQRGDMVIGTVVEVGPSNWYIDIGAPGDVGMHVNDVPWRVDFGETSKYLAVGDTVLLKIMHVDELKKVQVSMKDRQARKLSGGLVVEVSSTKVPRIIGRGGSMVTMVKNLTNTRMFVGQNGVIWLDGEPKDVTLAVDAVRKIEAEAHTSGLTDTIRDWLRAHGASGDESAVREDDEPSYGGREERDEPRRERDEPRFESDSPRAPEESTSEEDRPEGGFRETRREPGFTERREPREGGFRGGDRRGGGGFRGGGRREGGFREGGREGGFREGRREGGFREGPREGGFREGPREGGFREGGGEGREGGGGGRRRRRGGRGRGGRGREGGGERGGSGRRDFNDNEG